MFRFYYTVFFKWIFPKISGFVNSADWIGKITSKSIRLQRVFIEKRGFEVDKKRFFSSEKKINSSNCIYDYAHSFFGEDCNTMHYNDNLDSIYDTMWNVRYWSEKDASFRHFDAGHLHLEFGPLP